MIQRHPEKRFCIFIFSGRECICAGIIKHTDQKNLIRNLPFCSFFPDAALFQTQDSFFVILSCISISSGRMIDISTIIIS